MSELLRIIDEYKDAHGQPSDSSIARTLGVVPQTLSNWRKRGFKNPPEPDTLRALAELVRLPYEDYVLQAALYDCGWRDTPPAAPGQDETRKRDTA